ncbi:MAG: hypothetical protein ACW96X_08455 [Promethearchaeota archaeon]|jgi:hypothetical protein
MGEVKTKLVTFKEETSATKLIALISVLYMIFDAINLFYGSAAPNTIFILYGILIIILAVILFISLDLIGLWKIKIPYEWWLLLIVGVLLVVFYFLTGYTYLTAVLVLLAFLIELTSQKKEWKASLIMTLFGAAFAVYDCILAFMLFGATQNGIHFTVGFFGLIAIIFLLLTIQEWFDIKIPFTWWGILVVGFIFFMWVMPVSLLGAAAQGLPVGGFGGIFLLIAFLLTLKDY